MSTLKVKNGNTWVEIPAGGQGVPSGGTTGQFLRKSNSTDYATEWSTVTLGDVSSEDVVPVSKGGTGATTRIEAVQNLKTLDLVLGTEIPDNSDLNNYTTPGTYYCANGTNAATLSNIPSDVSVGFKLVVYYKGSYANINQELYPNGSEDFYIRYKQVGTWYNWKRVLDTTDLPLSIANGGTGTISAHSASNTLYTMYIHSPLTEITANSDLDNYKTPSSTYYVSNGTVASTIVNGPTTEAGYRLIVMYGTGSSNIRQIAIVNGSRDTYARHYTASKGTWTDWGRLLDTNDLPLSVSCGGTGATTAADARTNLDLADVYKKQTIAFGDFGSAAKTITFKSSSSGNYEPCLLVTNGPSTVRQGLYIVALRRTSAPTVTSVVSASGVTITTGTGTLKLTGSSAYTYGYLIPLSETLKDSITIT